MTSVFPPAQPLRLCTPCCLGLSVRARTCQEVPVQQASAVVAVIVQRQVEDSCAVPRVHVHIVHGRVLCWVVCALIIGIICSHSRISKSQVLFVG